jgi:hypothetical protein
MLLTKVVSATINTSPQSKIHGGQQVTCPRKNRVRKQQASKYATIEDFRGIFAEHLDDLYQLSLLLTGDHERAQQCLVHGPAECVKANPVFREWALSWAKRTIIQSAICRLQPRPTMAGSFSITDPICIGQLQSGVESHFELDAVLALEDFERFVFVMSVLGCYSKHECALLLGCTRRNIEEARFRAFEHLTGSRPSAPSGEMQYSQIQDIPTFIAGNGA